MREKERLMDEKREEERLMGERKRDWWVRGRETDGWEEERLMSKRREEERHTEDNILPLITSCRFFSFGFIFLRQSSERISFRWGKSVCTSMSESSLREGVELIETSLTASLELLGLSRLLKRVSFIIVELRWA